MSTTNPVVSVQQTVPADLRRVTFTGRLAWMSRRQAEDLVARAGGTVTASVSRRTTMLVVGMDGWPVLRDGTVSAKLRRTEQLNDAGAEIRIVSEIVFLEAAGARPAAETDSAKTYRLREVCDLLRMSPETLQRWEAQGLIRSEDGRYDFQDIVSLKTIASLVSAGVDTGQIARSLRGLSSVLPSVDRPLAQLSLVEDSGTLMAELGDALLSPDGQLVINFARSEDDDASMHAVSVDVPEPAPVPQSAAGWFEHALALEDRDEFREAVRAYRQSLAHQPRFPEAHFNLGNLHRLLDRPQAAEEQYLMAVTQDPSLAAAWYNLADIQEEEGRLDEAIKSLRMSLDADPLYADAHYNLALCLTERKQFDVARDHWHQYLAIDKGSVWAERARRHLSRLPS